MVKNEIKETELKRCVYSQRANRQLITARSRFLYHSQLAHYDCGINPAKIKSIWAKPRKPCAFGYYNRLGSNPTTKLFALDIFLSSIWHLFRTNPPISGVEGICFVLSKFYLSFTLCWNFLNLLTFQREFKLVQKYVLYHFWSWATSSTLKIKYCSLRLGFIWLKWRF